MIFISAMEKRVAKKRLKNISWTHQCGWSLCSHCESQTLHENVRKDSNRISTSTISRVPTRQALLMRSQHEARFKARKISISHSLKFNKRVEFNLIDRRCRAVREKKLYEFNHSSLGFRVNIVRSDCISQHDLNEQREIEKWQKLSIHTIHIKSKKLSDSKTFEFMFYRLLKWNQFFLLCDCSGRAFTW